MYRISRFGKQKTVFAREVRIFSIAMLLLLLGVAAAVESPRHPLGPHRQPTNVVDHDNFPQSNLLASSMKLVVGESDLLLERGRRQREEGAGRPITTDVQGRMADIDLTIFVGIVTVRSRAPSCFAVEVV
jgi:hypothetical protein